MWSLRRVKKEDFIKTADNFIILFDSSSSMKEFVNKGTKETKYDVVKKILAERQKVLPDLQRAYEGIRDASGFSFDPEEAARAELACIVLRQGASWWARLWRRDDDGLLHLGHGLADVDRGVEPEVELYVVGQVAPDLLDPPVELVGDGHVVGAGERPQHHRLERHRQHVAGLLDVQKGEIHAIVGENGAGKSTLMSILYGFYKADSGEIWINGQRTEIPDSQAAIAAGIGCGLFFGEYCEVLSIIGDAYIADYLTASISAPIVEEGTDGVRIMTVHKAKGLEFDVVVLPDLDKGIIFLFLEGKSHEEIAEKEQE